MKRREQKRFLGRPLTPRELRQLVRQHRKWRAIIQPMLDAIDASTRITGDDRKIVIR